ncbi:hypothetical protein STEG23_027415 [Scotinomys teguina]
MTQDHKRRKYLATEPGHQSHKNTLYQLETDAERPVWLPECCVYPVNVPADTKDHEDDPDSTNIGTEAMDVDKTSTDSPGCCWYSSINQNTWPTSSLHISVCFLHSSLLRSATGTGDEPGPRGLSGEAGPEDPSRETPSQQNGPTVKGHTGLSSNSEHGTEAGQTGEPGTDTREARPSCSSASDKLPRVAKSKFFQDSEDESDEAEEEEDDSEECREEEDGHSSEEAENEEDEDDTEEAEEDDEEEEMMVPGMEGKEEPGSDSGTTAVVALIRGKQLIVANAGDSRCVVSEAGKALDMSYDHKPEDEVELARIKNAGGKVTMNGRVNGGLNLSSAIGDHFYKRNKNLPPEEQMISALPDIKVLTFTVDHEFMVIACDGNWNVMSSQEVVDFIQSKSSQRDENGELRLLSSIVEELLDQCLAPDTSGDGTGCDNMTYIIICFKPQNTVELQPESGKRKLEAAEENGSSDKKKAKRD